MLPYESDIHTAEGEITYFFEKVFPLLQIQNVIPRVLSVTVRYSLRHKNSSLLGPSGVSDILTKMRFLRSYIFGMRISSSMVYSNFTVQNLLRIKVRSSKEQEEQ